MDTSALLKDAIGMLGPSYWLMFAGLVTVAIFARIVLHRFNDISKRKASRKRK